jgi:TonB-linked SusC/RagA family outer membrane protein
MEKAFKLSLGAIAKVSTLCLMFSAFSTNATEIMASEVSGAPVATIVQQNGKISGTIVDTKGEPVIGANVVEKGTTNGTITDMDGKFSLEVKSGVTLEISYIGYVTQTVQASRTMKITLKEDTQKLDEIVVVGYGTQQKKDITGSVAVVDTKDLLKTPSSSVTEQLQGRAAGVVIGSSGSPGTAAMVRIRGVGTVNDNGPLYVIDGVSTRDQNLNTINPNDIESMQVLKDASAAAIYGAQASNGVILITTKKGTKSGQPKLVFDGYLGTSNTTKQYDVLNSKDRLAVEWAAQKGANTIAGSSAMPSHPQFGTGANPSIPNYLTVTGANGRTDIDPNSYSYPGNALTTFDPNEGTNWWNVIDRTGVIQNYQLTLSGGTEKGQYLMSANYFDQQGTVKYQYYRRYQVRSNTSFNLRSWLRVGENMTYAWTKDDGLNAGSSESTPYSWTYRASPWVPVYDIQGRYSGSKIAGSGNWQNPLALVERPKDNYWTNSRLFGNLWAEVDLFKGLNFRTNFGLDGHTNYSYHMDKKNLEFSETSGINSFTESAGFNFRWVWTNSLTYNVVINNKHKLNVLVGTEAIKDNVGRGLEGYRQNYLFEDNQNTWTLEMGENNNNRTNKSWFDGKFTLFGLFGRVDYDFASKYLVTAIVRRDGVSRFSKDNRYGVFPSLSLGWRLSQEGFMENTKSWLDDLKVRAGFGITGNSDVPRATNYAYEFTTDPTLTNYDLTGSQGSAVLGYRLGKIGNPDTKWEKTQMTNVGVDATFLNGKFSTNLEWYYKKTSDMLVAASYSSMAGEADRPYVNIGNMKNTGIEWMISYQDHKGDWSWGSSLNLSHYKNEVLKLGASDDYALWGYSDRISGAVSKTVKGHAVGEFYGYNITGFYESADEASKLIPLGETEGKYDPAKFVGKYKYEDVNHDGKITTDDRKFLGSPHPKVTIGWNTNIGWKNLDFSMFWYSSLGNKIFNGAKYFTDFWMFNGNRSVRMRDLSWEPGKKDAILPILDKSDSKSGTNANSYYVENGSYARLKNIIIGYTFPKTVLSKAGIQRLRLYVQAENLLTVTNYKGLDPDISNRDKTASGGDLQKGIDVGGQPTTREFLFGVNFEF